MRPHAWFLPLLPATLLLVLALGCARPPRVNYLKGNLQSGAKPRLETGGGGLARRRAEALLARRLARSKVDLQAWALREEAATGRPLIAGNRVTLLFDGPQAMDAMMEAIRTARVSINLETYIFEQDELGLAFADLLVAKQKEGVQVSVIYDCVGTLGTPQAFFDRMRQAGIRLCPFHPVNPLRRFGRWRINQRDHRKILVVDGTVAFTGGVNISKTYGRPSIFRRKGVSKAPFGWRDTHLRVEGPAVAALQQLFIRTWMSQKTQDLPSVEYFPPLREAGDQVVRVLGSAPGGDFEIYKAYLLALQTAEESIHLSSAYFVPDAQIVQALIDAARRGVEVKVLLTGISDVGLVFHAGRSFYQELLEGGVKVYQLDSSVMHAKTAVVDGVWSTVGSTNLDMRSFLHNLEVNVVVLDPGFGQEMEEAFQEDVANAREITLEEWRRRPRWDRFREWAARLLEYWL